MNSRPKWNSCNIVLYKTVSQIQQQLSREDIGYVCRHPEARAMVRFILHEAINRPPVDPGSLAAAIFDMNADPLLKCKLDQENIFVQKQIEKGAWNAHDLENISVNESSHSLLSENSLCNDLDAILRFCFTIPRKN